MMSLVRWLASRTPEQVADTIRGLRQRLPDGRDPRSLDDLAASLVVPAAVAAGIGALTLPGHQALTAAVRIAPPLEPARAGSVRIPGTGTHMTLMPAAWTSCVRVGREAVLTALGAARPGERRDAALAVLDGLTEQTLMWPDGDDTLAIPAAAVGQLTASVREIESRDLNRRLSAAYPKEPIAAIASTLGVVGLATTRPDLQAAIVAHLSEPENVRALVDRAPDRARALLCSMTDVALIETDVFPLENASYHAKCTIDRTVADQDMVWLAAHGLIVPHGPRVAVVPTEVHRALREGAVVPFQPTPAVRLATVDVPADRVRGEALLALTAAASKMGRLIAALEERPVKPRNAGGFPVRETRRLAKELGVEEIETIFWIDLANHAGLVGTTKGRGPVVVRPTSAAHAWQSSPLAARLLPLLRTWLRLRDVVTWWPFPDEPAIAYGAPTDIAAPRLRATILRTLATLPEGKGSVRAGTALPAAQPVPPAMDTQLHALAAVAYWFAPAVIAGDTQVPRRIWHTIYEAELLGVTALGALTDVGCALLGDDEPALLAAVNRLLPDERSTARFQADMTLVVTGSPTPDLATLLGSVADRESEGHAVVYRITPATLRRAFDRGADPETLLDRLEAVSEGPLPQPVRFLLVEARRSYGRMSVVAAACCVRCDGESLTNELLTAKPLKGLDLRQIAPTVLVSSKPPAETLAALRAAGYAPAHEPQTGATVVARPPAGGRAVPGQRRRDDHAAALTLARRLLDRAVAKPAPLWE
ncbi:MAG TPA: helicase-associated domain-containing protein [Jiangellales bacterium]|nr:helicase-associated domain-containing protein [Jiangellales bacterium]